MLYNIIVNTSLKRVCSFFGHRETTIEEDERLKPQLRRLIKDLIEKENYQIFIFGGLGDFDDLCHYVVTELKKEYPSISRWFCLYDPRHEYNEKKRPDYVNSDNFEEIKYLYLFYDNWYDRIYYRNVEIMNMSDFVIFYAENRKESGAYKAVKHALRKKIKHINLF